jgi:hypothetical protein
MSLYLIKESITFFSCLSFSVLIILFFIHLSIRLYYYSLTSQEVLYIFLQIHPMKIDFYFINKTIIFNNNQLMCGIVYVSFFIYFYYLFQINYY